MHRQRFKAVVWSLCLVATQLSAQAAASVEKEKPKPSPEDLTYAPSTFFDNFNEPTKFGKDIFFPKTRRFEKKIEVANSTVAVKNETAALSQFVLKGISGTGARRLAVINNRTVGQGETMEVKHNGQPYRVKCEQIKARSVILSIEGFPEKKELQLRDGL
jgi:hypothetical protein